MSKHRLSVDGEELRALLEKQRVLKPRSYEVEIVKVV